MMAWIWRTVAEASECLSPFGHGSWSSTMAIPVCKRYRCGSLVGLRLSVQWHAAIFIAVRDHECHNCYLVELSIATLSTDGETAAMTLTYERAVPSARKCTTAPLRALRSRGTARRPPRDEIARTLSRQGDRFLDLAPILRSCLWLFL